MRNLIDLVEHVTAHEYLYHATLLKNLSMIKQYGIKKGSYWGTKEIAEYYFDGIEEDGEKAIIIKIPFDIFQKSLLRPDIPSVEEPITMVLHKNENEIYKEWNASNKTWEDSLSIVGSLRYDGEISPNKLIIEQAITEAPIADLFVTGEPSKRNYFTDIDKSILTSDKGRAKIYRLFKKTPFTFNFYVYMRENPMKNRDDTIIEIEKALGHKIPEKINSAIRKAELAMNIACKLQFSSLVGKIIQF